MPEFHFTRVIQYTERVTVTAESLKEAKELALESDDAERNNDDTVIDIKQTREST